MTSVRVSKPRLCDRRHWHRVRVAVPVQFGKLGAVLKGVVRPYEGHSADLSTSGAYVITGTRGRFLPGDLLSVSVAIPAEAREALPFSRIVGYGRVVRVERLSSASDSRQRGLALAFCEDQLNLLGAMTAPVPPEPVIRMGARR